MTQLGQIARQVIAEEPAWRSEVARTARGFAAALSETSEFQAFEEARASFSADQRAQEALQAYHLQQRFLQPLVMLGVATAEQRAELQRLRDAWRVETSAAQLLDAEAALCSLSRALDELLSGPIGLGFAAACRPSCCG